MNTNTSHPAIETKQPVVDTSEVRKASFWIAQICVIIATVLGVYLAASQGLKQAMSFEEIQSDKANCYMRISLRTEMANNIGVVKTYIAKIQKDDSFGARKSPLPLQMFIWENMKFSPNTLETPPEYLNANVEFLRVINATYQELSTSGISTKTGLDRMQAAVDKLEKEIFPKMDAGIEELKSILKNHDVII